MADLREMALRVRAGYLAHPRAAAFASYRVTRRENEIRAVETGIGLLLSAGFEPVDATSLYLTFIDTGGGRPLAGGTGGPRPGETHS